MRACRFAIDRRLYLGAAAHVVRSFPNQNGSVCLWCWRSHWNRVRDMNIRWKWNFSRHTGTVVELSFAIRFNTSWSKKQKTFKWWRYRITGHFEGKWWHLMSSIMRWFSCDFKLNENPDSLLQSPGSHGQALLCSCDYCSSVRVLLEAVILMIVLNKFCLYLGDGDTEAHAGQHESRREMLLSN